MVVAGPGGVPRVKVVVAGPGGVFMAFVVMEDLLDKLKLLGYDEEFLKKNASYKPLSKLSLYSRRHRERNANDFHSRHYFALATNPGEQFFLFTNVAAWLIQKSGNSRFEFPQEVALVFTRPTSTSVLSLQHDDPNATVSSILAEMRKLDVPVDFPPNKLKVSNETFIGPRPPPQSAKIGQS